jgi:hypothetical protein
MCVKDGHVCYISIMYLVSTFELTMLLVLCVFMVLFEETWFSFFSKFDSNLLLSHKFYHDIFRD